MQHNKKLAMLTMLSALFFPILGHADITGIPVSSDGGLLVGSPDDPYWFQISGALKIDQRTFWGGTNSKAPPPSRAGTYHSGAFIRDFGVTFDGGAGQDWTYTVALNFDARNVTTRIDDAFLTYYGFEWLLPKLTFSIGQVAPGFCVSCATSSKWIPFLERSMGTNVFGPQQGLGISANTYNNNYSVTVAAIQQPKNGQPVTDPFGNVIPKPDLWQAAGRFTYAPINCDQKVLQVGFSGHIQEYSNTGLQFSTNPEMRSGSSVTLLNTSTVVNRTSTNPLIMISALNQKTIDFELLGIYGPWSTELEYQRAYVTRGNVFNAAGTKVKQGNGKNLQFSGYHMQAGYVLTGESRPFKKANGTMGQIKPKHKYGAWEVSARYSFVTLNDQDVNGGMAHNTSASLGWYVNNNIKFLGEYVYSLQSRAFNATSTSAYVFDKRHLSSIGLRMQVVF